MRLTDTWTQFIHDNLVAVYNCKYFAIVQHSFLRFTFNTLYSLGIVFIFCLFSASVTFFTFPMLSLFLLANDVLMLNFCLCNLASWHFSPASGFIKFFYSSNLS